MNQLNNQQAAFVSFLELQHGPTGRANLAELRRAATDPLSDFRDLRILGQHLPEGTDREFDTYRLTAALFALYATKFWDRSSYLKLPRFSDETKRRSLGASLRQLRNSISVGQESLDLRFSALLDAPAEDLAVPLRNVIQRIATADKRIPVDFYRLLNDLLHWNADEARRRWARDYWQAAGGGFAGADAETTEISNQTNV
ncbi:type I-E CRISPR-associated protein Cse2/CasB [Rudanella lutea]|uniref:type I-E CRISPR-associated protein Cse2/CasB n=1 Tax=Rudanella lutea TaxID=451374 RepID=UPI00037505EA|nr:type I-E CRISPR-associated protein Cse2/CasB [Rudanella lutea]